MSFTKLLATMLMLSFTWGTAPAADENYAISAIPAGLIKNANAVCRNSHTRIVIVSPHEIYVSSSYTITILNEKGNDYAMMKQYSGHFVEIENIEGRLYDRNGAQLRHVKNKDIKAVSQYSTSSIDDVYYKVYDFAYRNYPYTCEFEINTKLSSSLSLPVWEPQSNWDCAIEKADIEIEYPKDYALRHKTFHMATQPAVSLTDDKYKVTASLSRISATEEPDYFTPSENFPYPAILFASDHFEVGGIKGNMTTWSDFGKFFYLLNNNRDALPATVKTEVHHLTDTCKSTTSKIDLLYDYMKKNTRYLSIAFGIGGWQTLDATFVAEKGYGDCKALSNYLKALLKEVGITAHQALVLAGEEDAMALLPDFPCNQFNHVILCVPQTNDTTWIECTAKSLPSGYLSSFTDNRQVLLLTPSGGYPIFTPCNKPVHNRAMRKGEFSLNERDEVTGRVNLEYDGYFWEKEHPRVVDVAKTDIDNYLNHKLRLGSYTVTDYTIGSSHTSGVPGLTEALTITGDGNCARTGKNLFIAATVFPSFMHVPPAYSERKEPFQLQQSLSISDTIIYHLSGNYVIESQKTGTADYSFASYRFNIDLITPNTLQVTLTYTQAQGNYPAAQFADYLKLYKQISGNTANKILLRKID